MGAGTEIADASISSITEGPKAGELGLSFLSDLEICFTEEGGKKTFLVITELSKPRYNIVQFVGKTRGRRYISGWYNLRTNKGELYR